MELNAIPGSERGPIAVSKLLVPNAASNYVERPRLSSIMDRSNTCRLTVVAAPAGFGKTTLVSGWISRRAARAAWLSLEPADNTFVRFWSCAAAAINRTIPGFYEAAMPIFLSFGETSAESAMSFFLNELTGRIAEETILVVDDFHFIDNPSIHNGLAYLLDHLPPALHLVIVSRTVPPLPLSRMRARRQVLELDGRHLRFTADEAMELQNKTSETRLTPEEMTELDAKTEGWAVGLILAFHSLAATGGNENFLRSFDGHNRYVFDYLIDEVIHRQPQNVQSFLLRTSILERFSVSLCDAVTDSTNSASAIAYLEKSNLFVSPLDDTRTWYKYHHLFAEALRNRLDETCDQATRSELHRKAHRWFGERGLYREAIKHALAAEDFDSAGQYMERHLPEIIGSGEEADLLRWLSEMPLRSIVRFTNLFFFQESVQAAKGRAAEARRYLDQVTALLDTEPGLIESERVKEMQVHIRMYGNSLSYYEGDIDGFIGQLKSNLDLLVRHGSIANVVNMGEALLYRGPVGFGGRLRKIAYLSSHVSADEKLSLVLHRSLEGLGVILLADLLYELNRIAESRLTLEKALYGGSFPRNPAALAPGYILLSKILQAEGQLDQARDVILRAIEEMRECRSPRWQMIVEARLARLQLAAGETEAAAAWINARRIRIMERADVSREYENFTLARVLMSQGELRKALGWLSRISLEAKQADRIASRIEALLLQALCHKELADYASAAFALAQACELAHPEGFIRIFMDEGQALTPLFERWLSEAKLDGEMAAYANLLRERIYEGGWTASYTRAKEIPAIKLTEREREVLRKIGEGLSNEEIGRQLFLSTGTVKKYAYNIYEKLQVKNRVQAISRAKGMGLL
ncbi:LuxR C-terminal-related transcriptional regulator [Paenibacillus sp. ATY16]|uniref:LuxR C-terminal-related transcriptional regulator n=1 Tax=Paenibacillus sp. ATY16 TaxID=1759312 RepID=UPI00200D4E07|nr:LuxR C-terminal-related transcriptional regulator [Paenibacillus sp. ATY16]MCK9858924.1 LuxR C-terminal-related transcriptional regulator [Paenibacillus sp. ATY16]